MPQIPPLLPLLGFALSFVGTLAYLRDMVTGDTYPNRATKLLWSLAPFISIAAALSKGAGWSVLPVLAEGLSPFSIFLLSFYKPHHVWHLGPFDWACATLAALALLLWQATGEADWAALFAVLADCLAGLPVLRKAWIAPQSETASSYGLSGISLTTSLFVIQSWTFAEMAFPIYGVLYNFAVVAILFVRRRMGVVVARA